MTEVGRLPLAQVETVARVDAVHALMQRRRDFGWTAFAVYAVARLLGSTPTCAPTRRPVRRSSASTSASPPIHRTG
jgi:hypothetical protein